MKNFADRIRYAMRLAQTPDMVSGMVIGWTLGLGEEYFHILMLGHKLGDRCQWIPKLLFSPICHVRVVRFCVSSIPSFVLRSSELQA